MSYPNFPTFQGIGDGWNVHSWKKTEQKLSLAQKTKDCKSVYSQPVYEYITAMYLYTIYTYIYIAACTVWKVQQTLRLPGWQIHSPVGWPSPLLGNLLDLLLQYNGYAGPNFTSTIIAAVFFWIFKFICIMNHTYIYISYKYSYSFFYKPSSITPESFSGILHDVWWRSVITCRGIHHVSQALLCWCWWVS